MYLALALVTNDQHSREDYLRELALIVTGKNTSDEAKRVVASITRTAKEDPVLVRILDSAAKNLDAEIQKAATSTERETIDPLCEEGTQAKRLPKPSL